VSAATAAIDMLVALFMTRFSLVGLEFRRKRSFRIFPSRSLYAWLAAIRLERPFAVPHVKPQITAQGWQREY
jgi:hypothetical protein